MAQKNITSIQNILKRSDELTSSDRFILGIRQGFAVAVKFIPSNRNKFWQVLVSLKLNQPNKVGDYIKPPLTLMILLILTACGEPEIKLSRADKRSIDTLVNQQLDSLTPILDSICTAKSDSMIQRAADSIVLERRKKEERLRIGGGN